VASAGEEVELRRRDLLLFALILGAAALPVAAPVAGVTGPGSPDAAPSLTAPRRAAAARATAPWVPPADSFTPPAPAASAAAPLPADTDLLLTLPRAGLTPVALAEALTQRGYDVLPSPAFLPAARVRVPAGIRPDTLARRLLDTGLLTAVEPDARVRAGRLPDDPLLPSQRPYLDAVRAPEAWDLATGSDGVVVAVVDSGIDASHPDLASRIFVNAAERPDGRDEDGNGCVDDVFGCTFVSLAAADPSCAYTQTAPHPDAVDDEGHGTFVAGVAAAAGNNSVGVTGVAWEARILPVKVLDCTATGRISEAAAGILYAARTGARVIVVAFGSGSDSRVLREAVAEATDRFGALVVASVGNEGAARVQFPAAYPGVLAVAGSGVTGADGSVDYRAPAPFTNVGPEVTLFAPAVGLVAPLPPALCGRRGWSCVDGQPYARASGTSFAAPLAAGAAALLLARDPALRPQLAVALLRAAAQPLSAAAGPPGLLDVAATLLRAPFTAGAPGASHGYVGAPPAGPVAEPFGPR
jgi:subtilisin family serine protease